MKKMPHAHRLLEIACGRSGMIGPLAAKSGHPTQYKHAKGVLSRSSFLAEELATDLLSMKSLVILRSS
jgi:hypothetical protein